ncbi:MAG TPA: hypothetical protein VF471_16645 [Pseudoxanthomonas sp.]
MRTKHFWLTLMLASGCSCASTLPEQARKELKQAVIVERSIVPPYTGYIRTWIVFKVKASDSIVEVLYPHFEDSRRIPEVGEICSINYHAEAVDGLIGDKTQKRQHANVIDQLKCVRQ